MSVWFTSDQHFGHRLVSGHRGFIDTYTHDQFLITAWENRVHPKDDVWVLGDISVSSPVYALSLMAALPGTKHLITGNHDKCHPMYRDAHRWQRRYLEVFESVQPFARRKIAGTDVLLSHFPYHVDREEPRHTQYRLRDEGAWLLHGHLHNQGVRTSARELHVGVDAWGLAPVSLDTVVTLMEGTS